MTPLAMRVTRSWMADEPTQDWSVLHDLHCFDVTDVMELVDDLKIKFSEDVLSGKFDPVLAFLPAPRTWVEFFSKTSGRLGWLLTSADHVLAGSADVITFGSINGVLKNSKAPSLRLLSNKLTLGANPVANEITVGLYAVLAIINSPHILERRTHHPHKGFQRELDAHFGRGQFPLNAWTEIRLSVTPRAHIATGEDVSTHKKALHFCRAHLRSKRGRLEHVSSHWRGDAARGTKLSKYAVTK